MGAARASELMPFTTQPRVTTSGGSPESNPMSTPEQKVGAVRQFNATDANTAIHSWRTAGYDSLVNPKGWAAIHVVVQKFAAGEVSPRDLYDQLLIVENPGAVVVCSAGDKVGLVQNFRFTGDRLLTDAGYVKKLADEGRFEEVLASLGCYQWELPRGLAPVQTTDEAYPAAYILAAAKMESAEEAGFEIANARVIGRVNPNTTFFAHAQYVVAADFVDKRENRPEELEMLGKAHLFAPAELNALITGGELTDGLTLSALRIAGR